MDRHRMGTAKTVATMMIVSALLAGCAKKDADDTMAADTIAAAPAAPAMPSATEVQPIQLQTGAAALKGQTVRVNALTVVSKLGDRAFWVGLPNKNPFLVMTRDNTTVKPQDAVDVVGQVVVMNDSILKDWVASGAITENQKLEAEFATEFLQAEMIQPAGGAPQSSGMQQPPTKAP